MNRIVAFALKQQALMVALFVFVCAAGLVSFLRLNIEAYPDPIPPLVDIVTQNPGQSAEEMERYVTVPLEIQMAGIPHVSAIRTISLFGLSRRQTAVHLRSDLRRGGASGDQPARPAVVAAKWRGFAPRLGIAGQDDDDDIVEGIVLMRRGEQTTPTIRRVEAEMDKINASGILPQGVRLERFTIAPN